MIDTHEWGTFLRIPCIGSTARFASVAKLWLHQAFLKGDGSGYWGAGREMVLYCTIVRGHLFLLFPKPHPAPVAESWSSR